MKTASISIYQLFGTKSSICADITYRGKLLAYVEGLDLDQIQATVRMWSRNRGFSHVKLNYSIPSINRICKVKA